MSTWYFQPVFGSYLLVALVATALAALLLVGPVFKRISWPKRATLIGLRALVILLLLLGLLQPSHISTTSKPQTGVVIVLADITKSMSLPSGNTSRNRYETQQGALRSAEAALAELAKQ